MGFDFDLYVRRKSWLHRLDPRAKLLISLVGMVVLLTTKNIYLLLGLLLLFQLLLISAKIPGHKIVWIWKMMMIINIIIPLVWPLFYQKGTLLFQFGFIKFTSIAFLEGLSMAIRVDALAFACFLPLFCTNQGQLVRALVAIGMPYNIGLMIAIALRYVPTLYGSMATISQAQQSRGLELAKGSIVKKLRAYLPILTAMVISSLSITDKLAMSLECRGFAIKGVKRTSFQDLKATLADYMISVAILIIGSGLLLIRFLVGFGSTVI